MGDYGDSLTVDALGRPVPEARPNSQVYNGILRAPTGAWGDQRKALGSAYIQAYGGPSDERGFHPMVRGSWVGNPEQPTTAKEQALARMG